MRLPLLALTVFGLAACSNGGEAPPAEAPPPAAPAVLGGVDLGQPVRAIGTEPFWGVEITPEHLAYTAVDHPGLTATNPGPTIQGTTAVYAAAGADGTTLVVTLIATECSDGMSDRIYPLTARVELGSQKLNGCAASVAFLNSQPAP
ncbi:COG3650 family protein [Brevundimonas staleyi]|uniref:COG3650 family protein n=1 Tax=Brevundimonas staleyi TaxID=74326 RepID=A0ABW0FSS4_9CAUL